MYRNLSPTALGVSGRQSELIELAMTYGFEGVEFDLVPIARQVTEHGADHAMRFISSANIAVSTFELPVRWQGEEKGYKEDLAKLGGMAAAASAAGLRGFHTQIMPASDELPYHENFEFHRERLGEIADLLGKHSVRLGLNFTPDAALREGSEYQFIFEVEALLLLHEAISRPNLALVVDLLAWELGGGNLEQINALSADQVLDLRVPFKEAVVVPPAAVPAEGEDGETSADAESSDADADSQAQPASESTEPSDELSKIVQILAAKEYDGPITPYPHLDYTGRRTREAIVEHAAKSLDGAWDYAGLDKPRRIYAASENM